MNSVIAEQPASKPRQSQPDSNNVTSQACVARAAKQPMTIEAVDLGPFGAEDVEIAVEHCALLPNASRQVSK